jgi:hypothetical protein
MNKLKLAGAVIACSYAGMADASVYYTNETSEYQTATIYQWESYSYYGFDNWYNNGAFTVTVAPNETIVWDDYATTWADGGNYSLTFELISVE